MVDKVNILMSSEAKEFPPFSDAQKDAWIEAQRFVLLELTALLHTQGVIDSDHLADELRKAEWMYKDKPQTQECVDWYTQTLQYQRMKLGQFGSNKAEMED
jgi:hypothetical protein